MSTGEQTPRRASIAGRAVPMASPLQIGLHEPPSQLVAATSGCLRANPSTAARSRDTPRGDEIAQRTDLCGVPVIRHIGS
jgi:hypothetical protein